MMTMMLLLLGNNRISGLGDFAHEETEADRDKVSCPSLPCHSIPGSEYDALTPSFFMILFFRIGSEFTWLIFF